MIVSRPAQKSAVKLAESLMWIWRACKGWAPQVAASLAGIFSLVWAGYGDAIWAEGTWAFCVAVALGLSSLIFQIALQRPTYMELSRREENAVFESHAKSQAIERSLTVLIRFLADHCSMAANSDRVSVYYHHNEQFVMLARWSQNPKFNAPGRGTYPVGQGAIGDAWESSSAVVELPDTRARWNQRLEKRHGFPEGTAAALTMHSRSIAARRIASNVDPAGVIVFESTIKARATQDTLDALDESKLYAALCELVATVATMTPRVQEVAKGDSQSVPKAQLWREVHAPSSK